MLQEYTKDMKSLIASDNLGPVIDEDVIVAGADLAKGTIVGRVTASRKLDAYAAGNADGSENPIGVLLEDAAAAAADVNALVGRGGVYVRANMVGLDVAGEDALEARGIYFA